MLIQATNKDTTVFDLSGTANVTAKTKYSGSVTDESWYFGQG